CSVGLLLAASLPGTRSRPKASACHRRLRPCRLCADLAEDNNEQVEFSNETASVCRTSAHWALRPVRACRCDRQRQPAVAQAPDPLALHGSIVPSLTVGSRLLPAFVSHPNDAEFFHPASERVGVEAQSYRRAVGSVDDPTRSLQRGQNVVSHVG